MISYLRKKISMVGYRRRIIYSVNLLLLMVIVSMAGYGIITDRKLLRNQIEESGKYLVKNLSRNSILGVFSENSSFLSTPLEAILEDKNSVWAGVYNLEGKSISVRSRHGRVVPLFNRKITGLIPEWEIESELDRVIAFECGDIMDFYIPVCLKQDEIINEDSEMGDVSSKETEIIGIARVGISLQNVAVRMRQIVLTAGIAGLVFFVFCGGVVVFIRKAVSKPLRELTDRAREIGEGNLDTEIEIISDDEIGNFAIVFNQMAADLKVSRQNLSRLNSAVEQVKEVIVIMGVDGTIKYANQAVKDVMGVIPEEIVGMNGFLVERTIRNKDVDEIRSNVEKGNPWVGRVSYKQLDGLTREVVETITPVKDKSGSIINFISIARDITNELKLEKELRHAQTMEAIGTLAGGIAHDFNNILGAIIGYTELSLYVDSNPEDIEKNLDQILNASLRAKDLVQQILTFSRQNEQEKRPVKISIVLKEVMKFIKASFPSTVNVRCNIATEDDMIRSDPTQMHQVIMNLCTNAGFAMKETGGTLEVTLEDAHLKQTDFADSLNMRPGRYIVLRVMDSGTGMDEKILKQIFEPYFTTKPQGEGTGLGLSVIHGIVKAHRGMIKVDSVKGKGTTFHLFFPALEENMKRTEDHAGTDIPGGTECILVVDDENDLVDIARKMLEKVGYRVVGRTSSVEAFQVFQNDPHGFDLVLTDKTMPNMTGFELAGKIKKIRSDIPIVVATGFSESIDIDRIKAVGIVSVLKKPLVLKDLAIAIREVLDRPKKINQHTG